MTFLSLNVLNDFQAMEASDEKKLYNVGGLNLAVDTTGSQDYIPPSVLKELSTISGNRAVKIPALKDGAVTVVQVPGFNNIPINMREGDVYGVTAYDIFSGFRFFESAHEGNQIDAEFYRTQTLRGVLNEMAKTADELMFTVMSSRKTQKLDFTRQISQADGTFNFNESTDTLEISKKAVKEALYFNVRTIMEANRLGGNYRIVTSPAAFAASEQLAFQNGQNNNQNLQWNQAIIPADRRYISNQLSPNNSEIFTGYMVRDGGLVVVENFPFDFRKGTEVAGKKWSVSDGKLPYLNLRCNIFINNEATDATSLFSGTTNSNLIMTKFEEMAIWARIYVGYRYNSDLTTRPNDIVKLSGLTNEIGE